MGFNLALKGLKRTAVPVEKHQLVDSFIITEIYDQMVKPVPNLYLLACDGLQTKDSR